MGTLLVKKLQRNQLARHAFALVELVVAIVIIAILAAIIIGVYSTYTNTANNAVTQDAVDTLGDYVSTNSIQIPDIFTQGGIDVAADIVNWPDRSDPRISWYGESNTYGQYSAALATEVNTNKDIVVIAMVSKSGECAVAGYGDGGFKYFSEVVNLTPCAADGAVVSPTPDITEKVSNFTLVPEPVTLVKPDPPVISKTTDLGSVTLTIASQATSVSSYEVYRVVPDAYGAIYGLTPSHSAWAHVDSLPGSTTSVSYTLPANQSESPASARGYLYYVTAVNDAGTSEASNQIHATFGFKGKGGAQLVCRYAGAGHGKFLVAIPETWGWPADVTYQINTTGGTLTGSLAPGVTAIAITDTTITSQVYKNTTTGSTLYTVGGTAVFSSNSPSISVCP